VFVSQCSEKLSSTSSTAAAAHQPNVNENAAIPGSRNSISNCRSSIGLR